MTAEGTACKGAGEAPKAEFATEKVATAAPEDKAPAEREGEDVGGPFVIVNGDSDGLSDRGSDLDKAPDEDSPSEEDEVPGSNAAPDATVGGDHGAATGEEGASGAEPGVSSADGRDRAAEEPEAGVDDGKGEQSADSVTAEVVQQETTSAEQGGADAVFASGSDCAIADAASEAPAVESEVNGKEGTEEESAATEVSELMVHEAPGAEQNVENAATESCGHDDALTKTESSSAATVSEVHADDNREEQSVTTEVELLEQSTGASGSLMTNGHNLADTKADSFEAANGTQSHDDESKSGNNASEVEKLVERDDGCGEQDGAVGFQTNEHTHFSVSVDSCIVASESEGHGNEVVDQESDQQEEATPITEAEVERVPEAAGRNSADNVEESVEEEADADEHSYVKVSTSAVEESEPMIEKLEGEATCGILHVEEKMEGEGSSYDEASGVASNEEVKFSALEGMNGAVPGVGEPEETNEDTNQEIVHGDGLVKDGETDPSVESSQEQNAVVGVLEEATEDISQEIVHGDGLVKDEETDPSVESNQEQNAQVEIVTVDETAAESDMKADSMVEVNTTDPLLSQQNCDSVVETVDNGQLEASDVGQPNEIENDIAEAMANKEAEREISDAVPGLEAAASADTFHNGPQSTDFVDSGSIKLSSPLGSELGSCDHTHTEENSSQEISDTTVQIVPGASLQHGSIVVGKVEPSSVSGDLSQEEPGDTAVDQGEPTLNADELVVADDAEPDSTTEYESSGIVKVGDIYKKDDSGNTAGDSIIHDNQPEPCNVTTTCDVAEDTSSESLNASTHVVEAKCLEEHNVEDEPAHDEESKVVEDNSLSNGDPDKSTMGDSPVTRQQRVYLIKVPRFAGEDLWAKIQDAHVHLDQLTQERDAINIRKQKQKLVCDQHREKLEAARREEREARAAHGDKKNDLNSVRSVIGKLNQANSIEEIEELIATKEKIMQHETISLKEEKLLIKEITDLKAQRKQLCSNMGSKAEINEAFDQKEHIHERHKTLKKDSDVLFTNLKSLEENTKKIQKSFEDERIVLRKLNEEYRVANERRQKAYSDWAVLKAEPFKKNKYFFMYKDDRRITGEHMSSGDLHQLQLYCNNQVERVMELWNNNEDFRKQYVEANKVSTLRRLGTHDGRRLGPDEDPPVIPIRRPSNPSSSLTVSSPDVPTITSVPDPAPVIVSVKEDSFPVLPSPDISKRAKSKPSGTSVQNEKIMVTVSERDVKETEKEKARLMEEELEQARKAEELSRMEEKLREEKAAAEKERLRLEQKAKAKEAEERKKRKAEKAQERAEFKARKEAEMKEKKKAKKDKKKGPADSSVGDGNSTALATADTDSNASDNPREVEVPQPTAPKRISRDAAAIKQLNRLQPMPAPLRNRGKRKMRQYILIAAAVLSVLALFVAGNYIPRLKSLNS